MGGHFARLKVRGLEWSQLEPFPHLQGVADALQGGLALEDHEGLNIRRNRKMRKGQSICKPKKIDEERKRDKERKKNMHEMVVKGSRRAKQLMRG